MIGEENRQGQPEILHEGAFDIVVNSSADKVLAQKAKTLALNGIKKDLNPVGGWFKDKLGRVSGDIFVDDQLNPKFLVKKRWMTKDHSEFKAALKIKGGDPEKSTIYACNSVLNEMSISLLVKNTVSDEKFQQEIRSLGFAGLKFVEPLLAVVDRDTAGKYVFYEHVPGKMIRYSQNNASDTIEKVKAHLIAGGIWPNDFRREQLLFNSATKMLYLIDTEAFLRK